MNIERLTKSIVIDDDGCWIWQKSCNSAGYGQLTENKKYWLTHVYAYVCINGPIDKGSVVRHKCHKTRCCNPDHLEGGTHKENWEDSADIHIESSAKRRKIWNINGIDYGTCREAVNATGLSMHTVIKYTINGVFDLDAYRQNCKIAGWTPKV